MEVLGWILNDFTYMQSRKWDPELQTQQEALWNNLFTEKQVIDYNM